MSAIVNSVTAGSIAQELGIKKGDILLSVDGQKLSDMIDYNFHMKSELVTIELKRTSGEIEEIEIENLQIFANTVTMQNLEMIPLAELPESWNKIEVFETPPQNL